MRPMARWNSRRRLRRKLRGDLWRGPQDTMLLHHQNRPLKKFLLSRCNRLALWQYPRVETDQSLTPASQINQSVISAGASARKMHQLPTLEIEMQRPHPRSITQRQAASTPGRANPGNHRS